MAAAIEGYAESGGYFVMAEQKPRRLSLMEFPGLINNTDPRDIPNGAAQVQQNLTVRVEGLLSSRKGFRIAAADETALIDDLTAEEF